MARKTKAQLKQEELESELKEVERGYFVRFFDDYHDIDGFIDASKQNPFGKLKGEGIYPYKLGFDYNSHEGGLTYPGIFWLEKGEKPTNDQIVDAFKEKAAQAGYDLLSEEKEFNEVKKSKRLKR